MCAGESVRVRQLEPRWKSQCGVIACREKCDAKVPTVGVIFSNTKLSHVGGTRVR